ncbi:MAG TPA: phosphodiester glycosidase family protein [Actinomycetota bacterium]|nr:phosphodiester glycosidase family protein [Actinomycetota bacterium]
MKPTIPRHVALSLGTALLLSAVTTWPSTADDRSTRTGQSALVKITKQIAPGLKLTKIRKRKPPLRIFVLTADISRRLTMDVALADSSLPARSTTSDITKRNGAIAAVNGDFSSVAGAPINTFQQDGEFVRVSSSPGILFSVSKDEQTVTVGRPEPSVTATDSNGRAWTVDRWNDGPLGVGEIGAYTPFGGTLWPPPAATCSARLLPTAPFAPTADGLGFQQSFTIEQRGCFQSALPATGAVVLSALPASDEALQILSLQAGSAVTLEWTLGRTNVWDAVGGSPVLVANGQRVVGTCTTSFCSSRLPRTGVGVTAGGKILMVVVDGRQTAWSVGVSLPKFAAIFRKLGAVSALNLDGGGSSTMVVRGDVVNRPSSGHERSVSTALMVLPGADPGEPG